MKRMILAAVTLVVVAAIVIAVAAQMLLSPERVRAALEAQASTALGQHVSIGEASAQLWPRPGVVVSDVAIGEPALVSLQRARVSTGLGPLLSRRVEDAEIVIEDSEVDIRAMLAALDAAGTGAPPPGDDQAGSEAGAEADASSGFTIVNVRTIALRNVELVAGSRRATVSLESSLDGDTLEIESLTAKAERTSLEATGRVESIAARRARLDIDADPLDLDGLLQFAGALSEAPAGGGTAGQGPASPAGPMDIAAEVDARTGQMGGLPFTDLHATIAVTPGRVTVSDAKFAALGGTLEGGMTARLAASPVVDMNWKVAGADLSHLSAFASGTPTAATGTLDATTKVTVHGLDLTSATESATGTADVVLSKGAIPGLQLVRPAVLAFGRPDGAPPEGEGEAFDRIAATIQIGSGALRTENLTFESRDVDMDGGGAMTLADGDLDFNANLRLSEELSKQAGRDLVRYANEDGRVVLPARLTGTVASPFVMIDMKRAAERAVTNEIRDRAKSALDRLLGRKKKPERQN